MIRNLILDYWIDGGWYVGRLKEIPGVFSQGKTLKELEENIIDAYKLILEDNKDDDFHENIHEIELEVSI